MSIAIFWSGDEYEIAKKFSIAIKDVFNIEAHVIPLDTRSWRSTAKDMIKKSDMLLFLLKNEIGQGKWAELLSAAVHDESASASVYFIEFPEFDAQTNNVRELFDKRSPIELKFNFDGIHAFSRALYDKIPHNQRNHCASIKCTDHSIRFKAEIFWIRLNDEGVLDLRTIQQNEIVVGVHTMIKQLKKLSEPDSNTGESFFGKETSVDGIKYAYVKQRLDNIVKDYTDFAEKHEAPIQRDLVKEFWLGSIMGRIEDSLWTTNVASTSGSYGRKINAKLLSAQRNAICGHPAYRDFPARQKGVKITRVFVYKAKEIVNPETQQDLLDLMLLQALIGINVKIISENEFNGKWPEDFLCDEIGGRDFMILDDKAVYISTLDEGGDISRKTTQSGVKFTSLVVSDKKISRAIEISDAINNISESVEVSILWPYTEQRNFVRWCSKKRPVIDAERFLREIKSRAGIGTHDEVGARSFNEFTISSHDDIDIKSFKGFILICHEILRNSFGFSSNADYLNEIANNLRIRKLGCEFGLVLDSAKLNKIRHNFDDAIVSTLRQELLDNGGVISFNSVDEMAIKFNRMKIKSTDKPMVLEMSDFLFNIGVELFVPPRNLISHPVEYRKLKEVIQDIGEDCVDLNSLMPFPDIT